MQGDPIRGLLSAAAVRERAHEMLELALEGNVEGFAGRYRPIQPLKTSPTRSR